MRGLWILGGLIAAAALLAAVLLSESSADVRRKYDEAVKDRDAIEKTLAECSELVRYFADRKPIERKKTELEELRGRYEKLVKRADDARADESSPREERIRTLAKLGGDFWQLLRDAEDLRARLREMKNADDALKPLISKLGELTKELADARSKSTDPEFQQRAEGLIDEGKKARTMAESGLKTLSVKITEGRTIVQTYLNELAGITKRMEELLDKHAGAPPRKDETKQP